ncbi:MAG: efflux RND transporter permease subunit [Prevotellaceae bacterium]|jgi:HAE1 family hydrophobic/amphiphilic exporter-1|nr:efflux RND transporter permease subunit [Prevotellaceae bacterium]
MSIYKSAVQKPITTIMVFVAIIVMGLYSLTRLPVDLLPEMDPPYISVMTTYAGANAADIEVNITKLIEDRLSTVDKLKEIQSSSIDNMSIVTLEFEWETDLDVAVSDVRNALDMVYDYLPDNADRPTVFKFNTNMMPIAVYAITAEDSYSGLEKIIDEKVVNPLNRIDGIATVSMMGAPKRTIYVDVDANRMDAYNVTIEQIGNVIASENRDTPAGNVKMGKDDYQLRIEGEFNESSEIRDLIVGSYNGQNIYVRDVATVRDTIKDISIDERVNGMEGMRLMVSKQSGANTVSIASRVQTEIARLQTTLPPDIKIEEIYDSSEFISNSISNLSETLMYALIFVILVVLVFLGRWRATFIIALTIPISLIAAFIYLMMSGNSINIISLSSLSIAIGMVVDDAIVVLENITKHIERGSNPREAAIYATNEVWLSVIVTTLVILAVFLPLTMVGGMTGVMFRQLGFIVSITCTVSTVAAITLTPMLSSKMLKAFDKNRKQSKFSYDNTIGKALDWLDRFYEKILRWSLRHKKVVMLVVTVIFVSSMYLFKFIGTDFMPETDESRINAMVELHTATRVEETMKTARTLENEMRSAYPEIVLISASSGSDDEAGIASLFSQNGSNYINFTMKLVPIKERTRSVFDIANDMRKRFKNYPEIVNYNITTSQGMGGSNTVDIEIYGYDFNTTNALAEEVKQRMEKVPGAADIQISRKDDRPELKIVLDKEKLAQHGLTTSVASGYIRNRVDGLLASYFRESGDEYDIIVRLKEDSRNSIDKLEEMSLLTPQGTTIRVKEIGKVEEFWSPPNIEHKRKQRMVTVSIKPVDIALGDLATVINSEIAKMEIPQEVMLHVGGVYEDQQESFMDLGLLMLLSLLLVFIVMASQFESFTNPFVIMFAIPFAISGSALALYITGTTLNMIAALGMVLLIGIVVKNGIVLVDFMNLMRDRGLELNNAIALSGKSRLRPVLMTSLTTILGMVPMAISTGEGAEIWAPMGITVIGGLIFSTLVTLIVVPVMYAVVSRHGERNKVDKLRKRFHFINTGEHEEGVS